jgi:hypothetical protein
MDAPAGKTSAHPAGAINHPDNDADQELPEPSRPGIHISVAVAWQRASAGDWTTYAADYSRRTHQHHTSLADVTDDPDNTPT